MASLRWTPQALADVEAICAYIARDAPRTAKRFGRRLFSAVEPLEQFPYSGSIVPELRNPEIREIRLKRYRIVYRIKAGDAIEILTVHHGSRLFAVELLDE